MSKWRALSTRREHWWPQASSQKPDSSSVVRGLVDSIAAASNTLSVLRVTITTSTTTEFEDDSSQKLRPFRLSDLRTGDYVEVRGAAGQTGGLEAKVLMRETPIQCPPASVASSVNFPTLIVLGITVTTLHRRIHRSRRNCTHRGYIL